MPGTPGTADCREDPPECLDLTSFINYNYKAIIIIKDGVFL